MRAVAVVLLAVLAPVAAAGQSKKAPAKKPAATPKPTVQVAKLQVVTSRAFNWSEGTTLAVVVGVEPPFGLVALNKEKSTLAMLDAQGQPLGDPEVDWSPDFKDDRSAAMVDLEAKGLAPASSPFVNAKGTLLFTIATGTKTIKAPNVKLEKGVPVKVGGMTLTIDDVDKEGFGDGPIVRFAGTSAHIKTIKALRAKDAKGGEVEASWSSSGTWEGEDGYQTSYRFKTAATALNLEFDVWDGIKDVPVPFDVKAGVGLGGAPE